MLDKSPEMILGNDLREIQKKFEENIPNIVLCSEPFHKIEFLNYLITSTENPVIFVDMDLLYTGYVESQMMPRKENVEIVQASKEDWSNQLTNVITKASKKKTLVIIDSLNMVYNMFDDLDSTIFINSCIMLLSSIARQTNSSVIITGIARKKENKEWILVPGGKQIIKSSKTRVYFLKKNSEDLVITEIKETTKEEKRSV